MRQKKSSKMAARLVAHASALGDDRKLSMCLLQSVWRLLWVEAGVGSVVIKRYAVYIRSLMWRVGWFMGLSGTIGLSTAPKHAVYPQSVRACYDAS